MSDQPTVWMCATCRRALNWSTSADGVTLVHPTKDADDHPVQPVIADATWRPRCDFCSADDPEFALPARDMDVQGPDGRPVAGTFGWWAACAVCADLIRNDRWKALVVRAVEAVGYGHSVDARVALWEHYQRLRQAITGPLVPIKR